MVLTATSGSPITWNSGTTGPTLVVTTPGLFVATATNACGSDSDAATVTAVVLSASLSANPTSGTAPLAVTFTPTSLPSDATVVWEFDDNTSSTQNVPQHVFTAPGSYSVELTVTAQGCVVSSSTLVIVTAPAPATTSTISIPNVFSPNGDRVNDLLLMTTANITSVEVLIFNRWGQQVNELNRIGEHWDGRSNSGELVSEGTYFYVLSAQGADGVSHSLTGHITVLR